jgi:hypothetical protein
VVGFLGCILSILSFVKIENLGMICLAILSLCCIIGIARFSRIFQRVDWKPSFRARIFGIVFLVIPLFIYVYWAALPLYRYDQWNYHLVVGKWLAQNGTLLSLIADDHIYFTGFYEYFLYLFRFFSSNDLVVQGATNVFSFLLFITLSARICFYVLNQSNVATIKNFKQSESEILKVIFSIGFAMALFFSTPHREALINAKPESFLTPLALFFTWSAWKMGRTSLQSAFLTGFLSVFPLSIKITWIHVSASIVLASFLFKIWKKDLSLILVKRYTIGAFLGLIFCLPVLGKSFVFFGNPIHPAQFIFKSSRWSDFMALHWLRDNQPARDLDQYLRIVGNLPYAWLERIGLLLAASCVVYLVSRRWQIKQYELLKFTLLTILIFSIVWPLVGNPVIQPRYAIASMGIVCPFLITEVWQRSSQSKFGLCLAYLLIFGVSSSVEVKIKQLKNSWQSFTINQYYENLGKPYEAYFKADVVNQHRHLMGFTGLQNGTVLSDTPLRYFYNSAMFRAEYYDYEYEKKLFLNQNQGSCEIDFLRSLNIRYLVKWNVSEYPFSKNYDIYFENAELLDSRLQVYFLPESFFKTMKFKLESCREKP